MIVEANTGILPVDDRINRIQNLSSDKIIIQESGYLEVYVNNEAQTPVYYDNLMVMQSTGNVIEVNAYYPYGKIIQGLSTSSTYGKNNYKYNGKELQTDMDLNWLDYGWRMLDGPRWFVPDAYAEKYYHLSPYSYAANNPINNIDINGDSIWFTYQYDEKNQLAGITMHVQGKMIDMSRNSVNMNRVLSDIKSQVESSFKGKVYGVSFECDFDFSVVESLNEVSSSDHLFVLANFDDFNGKPIYGASNQFGGKVATLNADYFTGIWDIFIGNQGERSSAHELGHLTFLEHEARTLMQQGGWQTNLTDTKIFDHRKYLNQGDNISSLTGLPVLGPSGNYIKLYNTSSKKADRKFNTLFKP